MAILSLLFMMKICWVPTFWGRHHQTNSKNSGYFIVVLRFFCLIWLKYLQFSICIIFRFGKCHTWIRNCTIAIFVCLLYFVCVLFPSTISFCFQVQSKSECLKNCFFSPKWNVNSSYLASFHSSGSDVMHEVFPKVSCFCMLTLVIWTFCACPFCCIFHRIQESLTSESIILFHLCKT